MLTLGVETIVILLLIMGVVSAFGGYVVAQERQRRAGGGKSAAELRNELSEYKENVNTHFQTTAGLLHDMTEQYRAVYEHMASGAQSLCDPDTARTQIESLRAGLLPAGSPDVAPVAEAEPEPAPEGGSTTDVNADDAAMDPVATDDVASDTEASDTEASDTEVSGTEVSGTEVSGTEASDDAPQNPVEPVQAAASSETEIDAAATADTDPVKTPGAQAHSPEPAAAASKEADSSDNAVKP